MSKIICQICLKTNIGRPPNINERLVEFYDEICEFDVIPNPVVKFCLICAHLLKKFYNFQNKCRRAHKLLKNKLRSNKVPGDLHLLLPRTLGYITPADKHALYLITSDTIENDSQLTNTTIQGPAEIKTECYDEDVDPFVTIKNESESVNDPEHSLSKDSRRASTDSLSIDIDYLIKINKASLDTESDDEKLNSDDNITDSVLEDLEKPHKDVAKPGPAPHIKNKRKTTKKQSEPMTAEEKKNRYKLNKTQRFVDKTVSLLDQGLLDLGDIKITKEMFLGMFAKMSKHDYSIVVSRTPNDTKKIKKLLLRLYNRFNPIYETVYDIKYFSNHEDKQAEFNARKHYKEYTTAKYRCELCFKGFEVKKLLDFHNKCHDPSRQHACDICPMRFKTLASKYKHRRQHTCLYRCKLCPLVTYCRSTAKNHYDQHKGVVYKCRICLNEYSSLSTLNSHAMSHGAASCAYCARVFVSQLGLAYHVKSKHPEAASASTEQRLSCHLCNATFVASDILEKHMKKHSSSRLEDNNFRCQYSGCDESFASSAELRAHALQQGHVRTAKKWTHRSLAGTAVKNKKPRFGSPAYQTIKSCSVCEKDVVMDSPLSMFQHHSKYHPDLPYIQINDPKYLCDECGKIFKHRCQYESHVNMHQGVKPYPCDICGARFIDKGRRSAHRQCHGPRGFKCDECGKAFTQKTHLRSHIMGHIGERKFRCKICSKAFLLSGSLSSHIRGVHNNIRRVRKTVSKPSIQTNSTASVV